MNSLGLNRSKIYAFYFVDIFKKMKWHDDMMQCTRSKDESNEPNKSHDNTQKPWKASGALDLGRHNTPPLTRDLVPRSKDGTREKRKRKR